MAWEVWQRGEKVRGTFARVLPYIVPRITAEDIRLAALTLVGAGIVHICVTFAIPHLSGNSAFNALDQALPLNELVVLPPITPQSQPLPFMSPDARYAMCRYDTSEGPVSIKVTLPDAGWLLTLYSPQGDNFYYVPGRSGRRNELNLLLVPPSEQLAGPTVDVDTVQPAGAPLAVATRRGVMVLKAPLAGLSYRGLVETELLRVSCGVRPPPG
jgi:uncharacterized membrane protein